MIVYFLSFGHQLRETPLLFESSLMKRVEVELQIKGMYARMLP